MFFPKNRILCLTENFYFSLRYREKFLSNEGYDPQFGSNVETFDPKPNPESAIQRNLGWQSENRKPCFGDPRLGWSLRV